MKTLRHVTFYFILFSLLCAITTKSESAPGGTCEVGDVIQPGESCTYPGTNDVFSVDDAGRARFLFFTAGGNLIIRDANINGKSYTLVTEHSEGGGRRIAELAGDTAPPPPASVPNVMLRVVRVTPDWIPFVSISGWTSAVPLKESEVLKYYEVAIWEETSSVHLYEFPNDYDSSYGSAHLSEDGIGLTDAQKIAYREQFLIRKYTDMPDAWTVERSLFLKEAFMDIVSYLVNQHPSSEHHLAYSGHGGPGGRLFGGQLNPDHADAFLSFWSESLGKPLGVIDMGGPCNKAGFEDLDIFSEYARYYVASDLPNGGYTMDDWTNEKYEETDPETQYHNLFAANPNLEDVLIGRIDLKRKAYEYSRNNMISNQVAQANYLYSCDAFRRFSPNFIAFYDRVGVDYPVGADLNRYMIDNGAPQDLVEQFNDIIVHKADNKDFFQWSEPRNGILIPDPEFLHQQRPEDVNGDGTVDGKDVDALITAIVDGITDAKYDVNGDGTVNIVDVVAVNANRDAEGAGAPARLGNLKLSAGAVERLQEQIDLLIATDDQSPAAMRTLVYLQQLLATARPEQTQLLANYPNPFNPETWIPYQLAKSADVTLRIYATNGTLVRTLALGHQAAGIYQRRSRAAYWDGRNAVGEPVASGLYFYTLTAGDFSATRKMLIRK